MAETKIPIRPAAWLALLLLVLATIDGTFFWQTLRDRQSWQAALLPRVAPLTAALGLTDLCVATEARYTRHPAVSDHIAPFMDHPGSMEHFPSGSFWAYPGR